MKLDRDIAKFIVHTEDDILTALRKISANKARIIFSVTESGRLEGVITDGDFRRWLLHQQEINLNQIVANVSNKSFKKCLISDPIEKIRAKLNDVVQYLPITDDAGHLIAVAYERMNDIKIDEFVINEKSPTYIIAEIGNNHNGDIELAKKLVELAKESGANCAKFQLRDLSSLYANSGDAEDAREDLGSQYTLDLLNKFQLQDSELFEVFDYCKSLNITPLCTPWDFNSFEKLQNYGMSAYKIASADLTNHELLAKIAKSGKPVIASTGMSKESEVLEAIEIFKKNATDYILLHCNSTYPAPFKDINLNYLNRLKSISGRPVGYSGHERDIYISIAAVTLGAKVIERHFTIDRNMEGNDHKVSLLPCEFKKMVNGIRQVELALGTDEERSYSQGEMINRENLAKSLVANCDIKKDDRILDSMIEIRSPGKGLQPNKRRLLVGKKAKRDFCKGDFFFSSDILDDEIKARDYIFSQKWGVPLRYHDFEEITSLSNMDLVEIHLSYKDLNIDPDTIFRQKYQHDLVVHSPELFSQDHLLDLASLDKKYRDRSINELKNVVKHTQQLSKFFPQSNPRIIVNVGGFSFDKHLPKEERGKLYEIAFDSLEQLKASDIELIPQTMPPYPWHFGGQRYHNLFVDQDEIVTFCESSNYRLCLDISHSKLACNFNKTSIKDFLKDVLPFTSHIHIADAKGLDGEGLQIGEGEINFHEVMSILQGSNASFIPEIWQGHKNKGEGFWKALHLLEKSFPQI